MWLCAGFSELQVQAFAYRTMKAMANSENPEHRQMCVFDTSNWRLPFYLIGFLIQIPVIQIQIRLNIRTG
jgi:hypothetical protein